MAPWRGTDQLGGDLHHAQTKKPLRRGLASGRKILKADVKADKKKFTKFVGQADKSPQKSTSFFERKENDVNVREINLIFFPKKTAEKAGESPHH